MNDVGVVAIGRNEGERLRRCLASIAGLDPTPSMVYVDSGSTDGSVELARSMGVEVVGLDMTRPFSAARARNAGFDRLKQVAPEVRFVMFVDGDCEVVDGWLDRARAELESRPKAAVVCGRRREVDPDRSIYNRLADLEWDTPVGEAMACGGDSMIRVEAFEGVGGFDPTAAAGEEPELCQRLRKAGWQVWRIDAEMTRHDLGMTRFRQWWRRQYRTGYNGLDIATRFPEGNIFSRGLLRSRVWAIGWPLTVVVAVVAGWLIGGALVAAILGGLALLLMPLQMLRLAWKARGQVDSPRSALAYGVLAMIAKYADVAGQFGYVRDRRRGRMARLIEYKRVEDSSEASPVAAKAEIDPDWRADLARYPRRPWLKEQSIWAIAVYRFGRRVDARRPGLWRKVQEQVYWLAYRFTETLTGIGIPKSVRVGPGLKIWHFGNIFVHGDSVIGANCTLRQGVTIGNRVEGGPAPVLGDDVELGAYAQILGGVRVGRGAKVGAMSVVLVDVPDGATAVGIPARIIERVPTTARLDG